MTWQFEEPIPHSYQGDGTILALWGDGEHAFKLRIGELRELGHLINSWRIAYGGKELGPAELLRVLLAGNLWPEEIKAIIRLALIGGGLKPIDAKKLVDRYIDPPLRPALESQVIAALTVAHAFTGPASDQVGKAPTEMATQPDGRPSPSGMEMDAPSVSSLDKLIDSLSSNLPPVSTDGTGRTDPKTSSHPL